MIDIVLLVFALVLFILAALNVSSPRVALVPLGLACWVASVIF